MNGTDEATPGAWRAADLEQDRSWVFAIDDKGRAQLAHTVKAVFDPNRPLFDYRREDFDLGPAWETVSAGLREAHHGRGLALVQGLPRDGLSEDEFRLLNWAIGLYTGVARPQGKASQYISPVRDAGVDYRAASGRGYSSNARLDFHVDGADLATLACYNKAKSGGQSMISSSLTAREVLMAERPDLGEVAHQDFHFSRQQEEAEDEGPFYSQPLFDMADGRVFGKWNGNRVRSAQRLDDVPRLSEKQRETMDALDDILSRSENMFTMYLEPGDLQIINNHTTLHSRTEYLDFEKPEEKRLLFRLWLAPPGSVRLPDSWWDFYRSTEPGTVRGGIRGHAHDQACKAFEAQQAASLGMAAGN
tara:strand:+ start:592 stop:1674 length:1083 start_codon:yes stop_codon:yes gene_type:complete